MATTRQPVGRRTFLQGAAVGAVGIVAHTRDAEALPEPQQGATASPAPAPESARVFHTDRPGSDDMVDVVKSLASSTSRPTPARPSGRCTNRSSTTAATRRQNC